MRIGVAAILLAGFVAYANGATGEFVGFNAVRALRDNPDLNVLWPPHRALGLHLTGVAALADGGTLVRRPVLHLSFVLSHAIPGSSAARHQAVNIVVHLGAALLLFGFVRRTLVLPKLAPGWGDAASLLAGIAALVWVVHPLHTESVTYVIQRAESLAGLLALATMYAASRAATAPASRLWPLATIAACVLALGTKETVIALPLLVWLYDGLFVRASLGQALRDRPAFYTLLVATWILPAWLVWHTWEDVLIDFRRERMLGYWLAQPRVILEYVGLIVWPHPLYLYTNTQRFTEIGFLSLLFSGGALIVALAAARRGGAGLAFLAAWFFLLLAPTSLIATNDVIHEHRTYLASAAIIVGLVLASRALLRQARLPEAWQRMTLVVVGCVIAATFAAMTHERNRAYGSEFAAFYPGDLAMAHGSLARHAVAQSRQDEALARYEAMLELPNEAFGTGSPMRRFHRARLHNDLGVLLADLGRYGDAREQFDLARRTGYGVIPLDSNRGLLMAVAGDFIGARRQLAEAIVPSNWMPFVWNNHGAVQALAGDVDEARAAFDRAVEALPGFELARKNRQALDGPFEPVLIATRGYDDPWLLLRLNPLR